MGERVQRRFVLAKASVTAAGMGLLAGLGLGRASEEPAAIEAEPAARSVITINGTNIKDGSLTLREVKKSTFDARYATRKLADGRYVKLDDGRYVKLDAADARYYKISEADLKFLKIDEANIKFLKIDAANGTFLKIADAANTFIKLEDADLRFVKIDGVAADSQKLDGLDSSQLVQGSARVLTATRVVAPNTKTTLFEIPGVVRGEGVWNGDNLLNVALTNLTGGLLRFATEGTATGGDGSVVPVGQSATVSYATGQFGARVLQIVAGTGTGAKAHTVNLSVLDDAGNSAQVTTQILIGL